MNSEKNLKDKKKKKPLFYNFCYDFVKITGAIPTLLWFRPKRYFPYGKKIPKGSVLISGNHRSLLDPVIVTVSFPGRRLHCLATKELYNTKLKRAFFNQMHCIEVDKENFTISAFHDVVSRLKDGRAVVIFPEGGLNRDKEDTLLAFKSGAVLMAHKSGAPILPIYIFKKEKWYQRQRVVIGEPFDVSEYLGKIPTIDKLSEVSSILRSKEIELREYFESLPIHKKLTKNKNTDNTMQEQGEKKDEQKV